MANQLKITKSDKTVHYAPLKNLPALQKQNSLLKGNDKMHIEEVDEKGNVVNVHASAPLVEAATKAAEAATAANEKDDEIAKLKAELEKTKAAEEAATKAAEAAKKKAEKATAKNP